MKVVCNGLLAHCFSMFTVTCSSPPLIPATASSSTDIVGRCHSVSLKAGEKKCTKPAATRCDCAPAVLLLSVMCDRICLILGAGNVARGIVEYWPL